jgi:hypothetical protein
MRVQQGFSINWKRQALSARQKDPSRVMCWSKTPMNFLRLGPDSRVRNNFSRI